MKRVCPLPGNQGGASLVSRGMPPPPPPPYHPLSLALPTVAHNLPSHTGIFSFQLSSVFPVVQRPGGCRGGRPALPLLRCGDYHHPQVTQGAARRHDLLPQGPPPPHPPLAHAHLCVHVLRVNYTPTCNSGSPEPPFPIVIITSKSRVHGEVKDSWTRYITKNQFGWKPFRLHTQANLKSA